MPHLYFLGVDLVWLVQAVGYLGVWFMVFAESGLFIGFFLPGDSLLFTAGFLASQGYLNIAILAAGSFVAAVLGDSVGYAFGRRVGPAIFRKEDSLLFHKDHLNRAHDFYEKHGGMTIILARFMPIVRTFAPILAGVGRMNYPRFLAYNLLGGLLWGVGVATVGYGLGSAIPNIDRYLLPIVLGIIFLSILPTVLHILRRPDERAQVWRFLTQPFRRVK
ncbi:MAG: VTT domain-containing protein [Candidatus Liptonbacteria bacterium]|nr:VTT domain-containing protein [Candidatus Liptonbacteria bacterium]